MSKFGNNISNHNFNPKGLVIHFLTGRVGWWDMSGGHAKKYSFRGGTRQQKYWVSRAGQPRNSFKFCTDGICDNWLITDVQKVPIFPGKYAPRPSTLSCTKKQLYATKMLKKNKPSQTYHCETNNPSFHKKKMECLLLLLELKLSLRTVACIFLCIFVCIFLHECFMSVFLMEFACNMADFQAWNMRVMLQCPWPVL